MPNSFTWGRLCQDGLNSFDMRKSFEGKEFRNNYGLGAKAVRYERILRDPLSELRQLLNNEIQVVSTRLPGLSKDEGRDLWVLARRSFVRSFGFKLRGTPIWDLEETFFMCLPSLELIVLEFISPELLPLGSLVSLARNDRSREIRLVRLLLSCILPVDLQTSSLWLAAMGHAMPIEL